MTKIEVESYSEASNAGVIRLPGRRFPGIVIQGDSLRVLVNLTEELRQLSRSSSNPELDEAVLELTEILGGYTRAYEAALMKHNHPLPY